MWQWIINGAAGGIFKIFGDSILSPILTAWAKGKDVDLQKLQSELGSSGELAAAVV
jgi:large-conductance mechanosensitive channel